MLKWWETYEGTLKISENTLFQQNLHSLNRLKIQKSTVHILHGAKVCYEQNKRYYMFIGHLGGELCLTEVPYDGRIAAIFKDQMQRFFIC